MSTDITGRVERGAALLDAKRPGWWREIDLDRLALGSTCNCVLGQIGERKYGPATYSLGRYSDGLDLMGLLPLDGRDYGFDMDIDPDAFKDWKEGEAAVKREFAALTEAWRDLILHRQQADDELLAELSAALREVPGEETARNTGREAWHARTRRGGQP